MERHHERGERRSIKVTECDKMAMATGHPSPGSSRRLSTAANYKTRARANAQIGRNFYHTFSTIELDRPASPAGRGTVIKRRLE